MVVWLLRAVFVLVSGSIGYNVARACKFDDVLTGIVTGIGVAVVMIVVEALVSKRPISSISAVIFGLLVGFVMARFVAEAAFLVLGPDAHVRMFGREIEKQIKDGDDVVIKWGAPRVKAEDFHGAVSLIMTGIFCYLGISVFYQTRDRFRFIIPYVEFRAAEQGSRPSVLDTSVIIDGRISSLVEAQFVEGQVVVPRFVLAELQSLADSSDRSKRRRGRRGLDVLDHLRASPATEVAIREAYEDPAKTVDMQLIDFARAIHGRLLTTDFNLCRIAQIQGIHVANLNEAANALKPVALPGEELEVEVIKPGAEPDQGVGYLDDGTMVVVERGRDKVGSTVKVEVSRVLETAAGHMVFAKMKG